MCYCSLRSFVITQDFWRNICTFYFINFYFKNQNLVEKQCIFLSVFRPYTLAISFILENFSEIHEFSAFPHIILFVSLEIYTFQSNRKIIYTFFAFSELTLVLGGISWIHNPEEENWMPKGYGNALWGLCYSPVKREELPVSVTGLSEAHAVFRRKFQS